jgi:hypothetical protein
MRVQVLSKLGPWEVQMAANGDARPVIADLYERWTLDIIPCMGQPCAVLCRDHPQEFKRVPAATLVTLGDLRYRTGYDSNYLDEQGRKALLMPVLGDSDGAKDRERSGPFHRSADGLRSSAKDFVQRVYDTGEAQLRDAFRDAVTTFQKYLTTVDGTVVADANMRHKKHFNDVVGILQTKEFAAGLGLPQAPESPWPLSRSFDGDGAMLVYAITKRAHASDEKSVITDEEFLQIQRIASYGAETIEAVLTKADIYTNDTTTDDVISLAYRWWTSLTELTEA